MIDPSILDAAGRIAYSDHIPIETRRRLLEALLSQHPEYEGSVAGYMEMLSMLEEAVRLTTPCGDSPDAISGPERPWWAPRDL